LARQCDFGAKLTVSPKYHIFSDSQAVKNPNVKNLRMYKNADATRCGPKMRTKNNRNYMQK